MPVLYITNPIATTEWRLDKVDALIGWQDITTGSNWDIELRKGGYVVATIATNYSDPSVPYQYIWDISAESLVEGSNYQIKITDRDSGETGTSANFTLTEVAVYETTGPKMSHPQKSKKGDARKLVGVTPKFYVKDDGTDYTTGEEYNGLWSAGTISAPTGFADCGIWKFLERTGTITFNNRTPSKNPISMSKIVWSKDLTADSIGFKLIDHLPLTAATDSIYAMLGAGGAYVENKATNWINYLQAPGLENTYPDAGNFGVSFTMDMWVYCRQAPQTANERQTFFHAVNKGGNTGTTNPHSHDSLLPGTCIQWDISNRAGTLAMNFTWPIDTGGETGSAGQQTIWSSSAAKALWPNFATDPTADGGLHHIAVIFDATSIQGGGGNQPGQIQFATPGMPTAKPDAFWIDGEKHLADDHANGCWWGNSGVGTPNTPESDPLKIDTNALIGCEYLHTSTAWSNNQEDLDPGFINHFLGKIYQISLTKNTIYIGMTNERLKTLFGLRFDIPRGPSIVDFSERYEYDGKNLLQEIGELKQSIESNKGTFHMNVNSIKVKN